MYYLIDETSKEYPLIKYYMDNVSHESFFDAFKMYVSDDIKNDFKDFDKNNNRNMRDVSGLVYLPDDLPYFISLVKSQSSIRILFHELTHLHDHYLFKKHLNIQTNLDIKNNPYYKCLKFWTEYHAKTIEMIYDKIFYKPNNMDEFTYFHNLVMSEIEQWKDIIKNSVCVSFHDAMWMFALINFAKKYTSISMDNIAEQNCTIPWEYYPLLPVLNSIKDFSDFLLLIDDLKSIIEPLPEK